MPTTFGCLGVDFVRAVVAFSDPEKLVAIDDRQDYGETRINMLAKVGDRVFHITFTMRGAVARIISARKANEREQRRYDKR